MKTNKHMTNREVAALLRAVAAAYEVTKQDRFRIRAYETAAESIEKTTTPLKVIWREGQLEDVPGIGPNLASHLSQLFQTGRVKHFDSLMKKLPPAMFELLDVPGIGPKTALKLTQKLKINQSKSAKDKLLKAAKQGKIKTIPGFGEQSQKDIVTSIEKLPQAHEKRILLVDAEQIARQVIDHLKTHPAVKKVDPLGSLRRRSPTVGDIDIAVATNHSQAVIDHFLKYPHKKTLAAGGNTARLIDLNNHQIDIKTVSPQNYGALLQHFTGSKAHNIHLRELALGQGSSLSEYGIKKQAKLQPFSDEAKFYQALGLPFIPPEVREDSGEIEAGLKRQLPRLVDLNDIKGDLHTHTNFNWSPSHDPGQSSIEDIITAALKLGYDYIGIGDHNPSLSVYKTPEKLLSEVKRRTQTIEHIKVRREKGVKTRVIKVLNSLEVDIRPDGSLALPDSALDLLDFAVVSIHSGFNMAQSQITHRILQGLSHPKAKILGHPTGRLLNKRPSYDADWPRIFKFCAVNHKILEINANPARLDLPDLLIRQAIHAGVKLAVNTDSHHADHLKFMPYGVDQARRGWASPADIVNTWPWDKFAAFVLKS